MCVCVCVPLPRLISPHLSPTQKFDLRQPRGVGDKQLLRHVAGQLLGLPGSASLVKRAIQFGSRIAREANTRTFGSHRAGKQPRCWRTRPAAAAVVGGGGGGGDDGGNEAAAAVEVVGGGRGGEPVV